MRLGRREGRGAGGEDALRKAEMVPQIDEEQAAMVALAVNPTRKPDGLAGITGAKRAAGMGAVGVHGGRSWLGRGGAAHNAGGPWMSSGGHGGALSRRTKTGT